jgi:leucyl aminopeptidase
MEIVPAAGEAERLGTELLVLGVFRDGPLTGSARAVNDRSSGRLAALLGRIDLGEEAGEAHFAGPLPGIAAQRLLLIGLGCAEHFSDRAYRQALTAAARVLDGDVAAEAVVTLAENEVPRRTLGWRMRQAGQILADGRHDFGLPDRRTRKGMRSVMLLVPRALTSELVAALRQGVAIGEGVSFAKELGDLPPDLCTPAFVVRMAEAMAGQFRFQLDVLERLAFQRARPARDEAGHGKLIVMRRERRKRNGRPIVLISDDAVARDMPSARGRAGLGRPVRDMRGIGSVFGAMRAVERLGLAVNVVGLVAISGREGTPCAIEPRASLPAGNLQPGLRGASPLGDLLRYAVQFSPSCVIDVAALSRAGMLALGSRASGLFANDEALASELLKCGGVSGDRVWQLPLWDADAEPFPEAGPDAGLADDGTDASFAAVSSLARDAAAYPWAHLDISGTASTLGALRSSTGRPVPLLAEFLIGRAQMTLN